MERLPLFFCALVCIAAASCTYNDGDIDIIYNDSGRYYSMDAYFAKNKTREVEDYLDKRIGAKSDMSFTNTRSDATFTLDDHTTFYMKKYPGCVKIKLDKDENSPAAYHRIKAMCEGIKKVLAK